MTISGGGRSTTTDAGGGYTLEGLPAGTHTLTPSKGGYTFSPPSQSVTVPPSSLGVNFVGASSLAGPLTLHALHPPAGQPSKIMRGGTGHRYFEVRDSVGRRSPFVTVTFQSIGASVSDANGLLDVSFPANSLGVPGNYTLVRDGRQPVGSDLSPGKLREFHGRGARTSLPEPLVWWHGAEGQRRRQRRSGGLP